MLPRACGKIVSRINCAASLAGLLLLLAIPLHAGPAQTRIVCRLDINQAHREELANKLRKITGWTDLNFDRGGLLRLGTKEPVSGSQTARELLKRTIAGKNVIVLEDASRNPDIAFSRVVEGRWKHETPNSPPAFVVQIDFDDLKHVIGDKRAVEAFNEGWALLHEFDHVVSESDDANRLGETGECESHINQMRSECGLPERADYFFTYIPLADAAYMTRLVRLAFAERTDNKKRRYWLVWDARLVGGVDETKQIAALR